MSDKQTQIDKEKVTIGCYISLALAIVFFSGIAAGSGYFWTFLDFTTLMGSAGKVVGKVSESGDGLAVTMTTLRGIGGADPEPLMASCSPSPSSFQASCWPWA